jgi:carbonic anhydrase
MNGRSTTPDGLGVCGRASELRGSTDWDYRSVDKWATEFDQCAGKSQSPIDVTPPALNDTVADNAKLKLNFKALGERVMSNNGHSLQVDGDFGTFELPRTTYNAIQWHMHFPSEHTVDGKQYSGEIQIVFQKPESTGPADLAYVSILLDAVEDDEYWKEIQGIKTTEILASRPFFDNLGFGSLLRNMPNISDPVTLPKDVDLNVFSAALQGHYAHYHGSVATPPCVETAEWYVMLKPVEVSFGVVQEFMAVFPDGNSRPVQARNLRYVGYDDRIF